MNLASWIILAIVAAIVGLAIKATFFKKSSKGGCCDTGDKHSGKRSTRSCCEGDANPYKVELPAGCSGDDYSIKAASGACGSCTLCKDSAVSRNAVQPIVKPIS